MKRINPAPFFRKILINMASRGVLKRCWIKKTTIFLFLIFTLGIILRFYRLGEVPPGFHRDEAFLGYNAYSILKTGQDMSGNFLPLHLKSFLYSPAGYSYFSIPFIWVFDLSAFSVRFASAFFGSLTIIVAYFLVIELLRKRDINNVGSIALMTSFLLAVSPWHINLSRTATENTVVVFFIALAVLIYFLYLNIRKWYLLLLSFFCFSLTLFIYQAPRAFLPFFVPLLILLFLNIKNGKIYVSKIMLLFFATILLPLFVIFSSKDLSLRIRTVSIFSTQETQLTIDEQIRTDGVFKMPIMLTRMFHNKLIMYSQQFLENYFSHFSYSFLFSDKPLPDRYRVPLVGALYFLELPLILIGVFKLIKKNKRLSVFLIGWIVIVPLGSALTFDDIPNLQRILIIFPALSILEAFGLFQIIDFLRRNYWLKLLGVGLILIFIYNIFFYLHQYYTHVSKYRPWYRQDGYKELIAKVNNLLPKYNKAVITNRESAPAVFFLFFSKYSPSLFQKGKQVNMSDYDRINFGKYEFSQEECPLRPIEEDGKMIIKGEKNILYVNSGLCKTLRGVRILDYVERSDNSLAFSILEPF